jgi:hypothetical protein
MLNGSLKNARVSVSALAPLLLLSLVTAAGQAPSPAPAAVVKPASGDTAKRKLLLRESAAKASFTFMPNAGQADPADLFVARGSGFSMGLERGALEIKSFAPVGAKATAPASDAGISSARPKSQEIQVSTARIEFTGANPRARVEGLNPTTARVNFLEGSDPARWKTNLTGFSRVRYSNLYPGIDLIYYGERERHLEYDLVVRPGADPAQVRLHAQSEGAVAIDAEGNLRFDGAAGHISLMHPVLYQDGPDGKRNIAGTFVKLATGEFGFSVGTYDHTRPLIIDPKINLLYATYAGGIHNDEAFDLTLDASGNAYITGQSASEDFPVTGNALQQTRMNIGSYVYDAVIMKFDNSGNLIFSTFLGGAQNDAGQGVRVDANGLVFIAGSTSSSDFPVTANALQKTFAGGTDLFFSVLSNDGSQLVYSTYLGGSGDELPLRLVQAANDSFWVAGGASAAGLPVTAGAYQKTPAGPDTSFIGNFVYTAGAPQPLAIPALTFIGGSTSSQEGDFNDLALDSAGNVYATGFTSSTDFPTTANAYLAGSAFTFSGGCYNSPHPNTAQTVAEFSADLKTLIYSSLLGGKTEDQNGYPVCNQTGRAVHPDGKGNIWIVGTVGMSDFPTTANALSRQLNTNGLAGVDVSLAELTPGANSTVLTYGSYLGGSQFDYGARAAWDAAGDIWITATTQSTDYPGMISGTSLQPTNAGGYDTAITELQPDGSKILYATYLGGQGDEDANSGRGTIALDTNNNVYLTGGTGSANYPVTGNAAQYTYANGDSGPDGYDIYYSVLGSGAIGASLPATSGNGGDVTITVDGAGFQSGATCQLVLNSTLIAATTAAVANTGTSVACTFALNGATAGAYDVVVTNPNGGGSFTKPAGFTVTSGGAPNVWVNVVARPKIRTGVPSVVNVSYGNSGSVDAYFTGLRVALPPNVSATYDIGETNNLPVGVQAGTAAATSSGNVIPLILPHLAAGSSGSFNLTITDSVNADNYTVGATIGHPWYNTAAAATAELTAQSANFTSATTCAASPSGQPQVASCLAKYLTGYQTDGYTAAQVQAVASNFLLMLQQSQTGFTPLISSGTTYVPSGQLETGTLIVSGIPSFDNYVLFHVAQTSQRYLIPINSNICVADDDNIGDAIGGTLLKCTFNNVTAPQINGVVIAGEALGLGMSSSITPEPDACFTVMSNVAPSTFTITTRASEICGTGQAQDYPYGPGKDPLPFPDETDPSAGTIVSGGYTGGSIDPNDKTGSTGDQSTSRFVRATVPLPYTVYFENEATATLPAANVIVTDQLDPTKFNLKSLTLGYIYFGSNVIAVPFNLNSYNTVYKISSSLEVRIQGSLNTTTGLLKWTFTSLDPTTGQPPTDPTVGFLPPDTNGLVGQGSVSYNVMPLTGQATGAQVTNTAQVVFDANAAIVTPTWMNTLDADPPVSKVSALPASTAKTGTTTPFSVSWSGTDKGSGIATYNVYVSDNGGAFTLFQSGVKTTSATYTGQTSHTYGFYSIATDGAGNVESSKTSAEAATTVSASSSTSTSTLTASATALAPGQPLSLSVTVAGAAGSATIPSGTVTFAAGTMTLGTATLGTGGIGTLTIPTLAQGIYAIQASYAGDATFAPSVSNQITVTVTPQPTVTTLVTSAAIAGPGVVVTFSANITPAAGSGTPTGTVTFFNGMSTLGMGTVSGGKATFATSALAVGSYPITAKYSGDTSFAASTSTTITQQIVVPSFTVAVTPATLSFPAGQSGSATLTLTPVAGFNQAVSFSCSGLPLYATCSFLPSSITPSGSAISTTLTIATNVATAADLRGPVQPGQRGPSYDRFLVAFTLLGIGGLTRKRKLIQRAPSLFTALLLASILAILSGLSGCSSNSFNATPRGTSNITVTASGAGLSQTANLSVTVQ